MYTGQRQAGGGAVSLLLQNIPLFVGLPAAHLEEISRVAVRRKVSRHTAIVHAGDQTDALFVIISGSAKVLNRDVEGNEVILTILGAGECFGEMGLIDGSPRSADVRPMKTANCWSLPSRTSKKRWPGISTFV